VARRARTIAPTLIRNWITLGRCLGADPERRTVSYESMHPFCSNTSSLPSVKQTLHRRLFAAMPGLLLPLACGPEQERHTGPACPITWPPVSGRRSDCAQAGRSAPKRAIDLARQQPPSRTRTAGWIGGRASCGLFASRREVLDDALGVPLWPRSFRFRGSVVLVQRDQQPCQLAADRRRLQDLR
jgi:hypothetical protein